ncbi:MAG: acetolactate decarboxylase [Bifidobacterium mongoliense]|jgi:acetolactate decarboxylase|uniref:acetolactate decarboxylase n=1 Tax=Bifidobacterium mongoliense TaxID=518643 RepID=UPI002F351ADE
MTSVIDRPGTTFDSDLSMEASELLTSRKRPAPDAHTLYQHGTLALLVPGLLDGTLTMGELLRHGDTGIGTGEGLDGEIVILHGTPYQVRHDGSIVVVSDAFTLPFANVHHASFTPVRRIANVTATALTDWLPTVMGTTNTFFATRITGRFSGMRTRVFAKQPRPYPTLEHTAEHQRTFGADETQGTLLAYYSPQLFNGIAVGGFHIHYLADDLSIGGHVLDFHVEDAQVSVQRFDTLQEHLPVASAPYSSHDFADDDIAGAIAKSE